MTCVNNLFKRCKINVILLTFLPFRSVQVRVFDISASLSSYVDCVRNCIVSNSVVVITDYGISQSVIASLVIA